MSLFFSMAPKTKDFTLISLIFIFFPHIALLASSLPQGTEVQLNGISSVTICLSNSKNNAFDNNPCLFGYFSGHSFWSSLREVLGVSYPDSIMYLVVSNVSTMFDWNCSRHARVNVENTHTHPSIPHIHSYITVCKKVQHWYIWLK